MSTRPATPLQRLLAAFLSAACLAFVPAVATAKIVSPTDATPAAWSFSAADLPAATAAETENFLVEDADGNLYLAVYVGKNPYNGGDVYALSPGKQMFAQSDQFAEDYILWDLVDGKWVVSKSNLGAASTSGHFDKHLWQEIKGTGVRLGVGIKEAALTGSDMIGYGAACTIGNGEFYHGNSSLFNAIDANPNAFGTPEEFSDRIAKGGIKAVVNVGTLGLYSIGEGIGTAAGTDDYTQLQDASLQALLLSTQAKSMQARGMNPWNGTKTGNYTATSWLNKGAKVDAIYRGMKLKNQVLYETGQTTVDYYNQLQHMNPVYRGAEMIQRNGGGILGLMRTLRQGSCTLGKAEGTLNTGPTPAVRFGLNAFLQAIAVGPITSPIQEDNDKQ
ncbi:MAG: hypothetical protein H7831_16270 [Magnetococcus sp. WYHC-3]